MTKFAVECEGLGKRYRLGTRGNQGYRTLRDAIAALVAPGGSPRRDDKEIWALAGVDLRVPEGEAVGIVGKNGAGKSTLLKILSRITEPTSGMVRLRGRVSSLLEVGTGFHPELTGRENILLNGAILGMRRREIQSRFDEIVEFSGVETFLETPVKRYSSGMYIRLAFAVAAHLESEILVVDEVLAVGDAEFQRKCLGRMGSVARSGRTVLFVSHNMAAVSRLCGSAVWLKEGRVEKTGTAREVVERYLADGGSGGTEWVRDPAPGESSLIERVRVLRRNGSLADGPIPADEPFEIELGVVIPEKLRSGRLAVRVTASDGTCVFGSASSDSGADLEEHLESGRWRYSCPLPEHFLAPGTYTVAVAEPLPESGDRVHEDVVAFEIGREGSVAARDGRPGLVSPRLNWRRSKQG